MSSYFLVEPQRELFEKNPRKYLITEDNNIHRMGDVTIELPVNAYRVPITPPIENIELVNFRFGHIAHSLLYHRFDFHDEDILFKAAANATENEELQIIFKKMYLANQLHPLKDETPICQGCFDLLSGEVFFLKTKEESAEQFTIRYQTIFFVEKDWMGITLFNEHRIMHTHEFDPGPHEFPIAGLSNLLHMVLSSAKIVPIPNR
jgi:hypothetical protein